MQYNTLIGGAYLMYRMDFVARNRKTPRVKMSVLSPGANFMCLQGTVIAITKYELINSCIFKYHIYVCVLYNWCKNRSAIK